ncbi:MAG: trypsin-like peptidase domain-containing protein [Dehalococcoidales bacterium]|nr:trypsin-like peptidase domain-containing protein [Dehalococcoidales bacterium]
MKNTIAIILLLLILTISSCTGQSDGSNTQNGKENTQTDTPVPSANTSEVITVADAIAQVSHCVVYIKAAFGTWCASGTGIIIDNNGYIITNNHVVEKGYSASIYFRDKAINAEIVFRDPDKDLAILKCPNGNYPAITLGSTIQPALGEDVIAIGFPFSSVLGDSPSLSKGVVSALRTIDGLKYIQTDASLNPGNSGGPLINTRGEVIGINTLKLSESEGVGFAIDVEGIKGFIESILQKIIAGELLLQKQPAQRAKLPTEGIIFQYHGNGISPSFSINSSPWTLYFKPEFDGRVIIWASETLKVNDWIRVFGTEHNIHLNVTAGRLYQTYIYSLTGDSIVIGPADGMTTISSGIGEWTVWVVEEPALVLSLPCAFSGEGEVNTTPVLLENSKKYKLTFITSWDGDISIAWKSIDNKVLFHRNTKSWVDFPKSVVAGMKNEYIFTWKYPTQTTYLHVEWAPPVSNWTIHISEINE